jgi:hypothetical protein
VQKCDIHPGMFTIRSGLSGGVNEWPTQLEAVCRVGFATYNQVLLCGGIVVGGVLAARGGVLLYSAHNSVEL